LPVARLANADISSLHTTKTVSGHAVTLTVKEFTSLLHPLRKFFWQRTG